MADSLGLPPLGEITEQEKRAPGVGAMRELEEVATLLHNVATALLKGETPNG